MQNFDLLDFLSHNYISLGDLVNQNMWRSYCYGDPNIWWWHLQEETEMPFGNITYYFTENNRYRVSLTFLLYLSDVTFGAYYLYIEDLKLSKVHVYVTTSFCENTFTGFLLPSSMFQTLNIELLDVNGDPVYSYTWGTDMVILKGKQQTLHNLRTLVKALLIFDKNAALLYLYDSEESGTIYERIIHFLSFSRQSDMIVGIEYDTSEVTNITSAANPPSSSLATGLNNTHTYIHNMTDSISTVRIRKNNITMTYSNVYTPGSSLSPLSDDFPWTILFFFRPTPVSCSSPTNCSLLLPINQHFTGQHGPVTIWRLADGLHLSINCEDEATYPFIRLALITSGNNQYFYPLFWDNIYGYLGVVPDYDMLFPNGSIGLSDNGIVYIKQYDNSTVTQHSCGIRSNSLFHYHGNNAEPIIWLFSYDKLGNNPKAYVIYAENMDDYKHLITDDYHIATYWGVGIYDKMLVASERTFTVSSYLNTSAYHTHLAQFFIFNTLAHTAPQVVNGSWSYMHYMRFVLDDYTSSNLRIPLAIVEGDIKRDNIIKYREIRIDKMATSQRYPIVQQGSLSKAHMPDVVLDGYIASLNADAGKNEDSTFGTLIPYYDLKEAKIQEPHPEWYFRIHIHAGTWYYIFNNIMSVNNNQMRTYRIQHNDGSLRIVLDVGVYFEIITARDNNKKYTIVYADIFPSVYWCHGNNSYEFLNVNVEWIQCRYSMPGSNMIRVRPNNNTVIIEQPVAI